MHLETIEQNSKIAAVFSTDTASIFSTDDIKPKVIKKSKLGYIPWGEENDLPNLMLEKIRASDVMSPNMNFNILTCYGNGIKTRYSDDSELSDSEKKFFLRNNTTKYLLEQVTDNKHFSLSICLLVMNNEGTEILRIMHKEVEHLRFELNNPKSGRIENVFFANWSENPTDKQIQKFPLLDPSDPLGDLLVRFGKEPDPLTGKTNPAPKERVFAVLMRVPMPGKKYYPVPYYASHFLSGWYDISVMIPIAKKAKMTNGMSIKYHVEVHNEYFSKIFDNEKITDPKKQIERKKTEFQQIKDFLSGIENQGKVWFSGYYIDPNGKENRMIRINLIDKTKEGGDYIEDAEEAANMQCYAMGVHPNLIGATPGKSKGSLSGSDKRELFTMKQAMETPIRDLLLTPFTIIRHFNNWGEKLIIEIPHLMLTTLDEGKDAKTVTKDDTTNTNDTKANLWKRLTS